ncbi:glycoside hydrolase [Novosphingobium terrae]|uniref:glycoside hydrolase n=1 Tax=Novosphingobium terrae TaxID=2726189 RepID=UPI00197F90DD|nr:glycoside hydrolase [Novosphingobium terrae]
MATLLAASCPAQAAERPVTIALSADRATDGPAFEGWGTALAWFAEVTGGYPAPVREHLADLFYGKDGLGWTIARFNIGGGNAADTPPYLRTGGAVPGYWHQPSGTSGTDWWRPDQPDMWDWNADPNQRWWLDAVKARVPAAIFEAFSNSPPWFMTISGRVSGAEKGRDDNLRAGQEQAFAQYLARSVEALQRRHGIRFRTLSPVNEPNTDYWYAANTQEGAHWSPARQAAMIEASAKALQERRLTTQIAAMDETNSDTFLTDWKAYPATTRSLIGQLNVHSYGTLYQTGVRDAAKAAQIRLWMSENDTPDKGPESFTGMAPALALADHIIADLRHLQPAAWIFWQAVETLSARDGKAGSNWGLIKMDLQAPPEAPHPLSITMKYWAMANFSRYIRPGMRLFRPADEDTIGAANPDGRELVFVHVNPGATPRQLVLSIAGDWSIQTIVTSGDQHADAGKPKPGRDHFTVSVQPETITTIRLQRRRD